MSPICVNDLEVNDFAWQSLEGCLHGWRPFYRSFQQKGQIMGFQKGKLVKNILYGVTHPLQMAREKPILFLLVVGAGVVGLGVLQGWFSLSDIGKLLPFGNS
mgnify:CR=1 FL=1